jgi:hypothetical protein
MSLVPLSGQAMVIGTGSRLCPFVEKSSPIVTLHPRRAVVKQVRGQMGSIQTLPYRLLTASGVCMLSASILLWVRSGRVMEGPVATRAADYNTIGLFFVWALAATALFLRDVGLHAHTKICRMFLAGLVYNGARAVVMRGLRSSSLSLVQSRPKKKEREKQDTP